MRNHPVIDPGPSFARGAFISRGAGLAFALVTALFFMWAIANNLNDILIKQFQKALDLTRMQSGMVQTAFYFGYFTMALPAGMVLRRVGYKRGILIGLGLYATGALLFLPAAEVRSFAFFLAALYIIAAGLTFLETAANPYVTVMGNPHRAAQRLNFAQGFNGLGGVLAPFIGGALILSGIEYSPVELARMSPEALQAYQIAEAKAVQGPYLALAGIVVLLAIIIHRVPFPELADTVEPHIGKSPARMPSLIGHKHLRWAIAAQFAYVGAQVGIWSYFINFSQDVIGVPEKTAAHYLGVSLLLFMIGRFTGTALMSICAPQKLLALYAAINVMLLTTAISTDGILAVSALGLTSFFMSVMFPTIFALGVKGLGEHTKIASSLLVMSIVGGALLPPAMGLISDVTHSIQSAMLLPLLCFVVVLSFGWHGYRTKHPIAESEVAGEPIAPIASGDCGKAQPS